MHLPERFVLEVLNQWIGRVFDPECRDETVDQLLESVAATGADSARSTQAKGRANEARTKLRRLQDAIKAGANPAALVDAINEAQAELEAAEVEQARQPETKTINRAEVYAMIDYLGDVGAALESEDPAELQKLYEQLRLEMIYHADEKAVDAEIRLGRDSARVRGPSCTLATREAS